MIYTLNTHYSEVDLTWAIGLQMEDALTRADVLAYLEKANMLEISELIKEIEEQFDVKAAAPVAVAAAGPVADEAAEEEQTEFDVVLKEVGSQKINVIKVVRAKIRYNYHL